MGLSSIRLSPEIRGFAGDFVQKSNNSAGNKCLLKEHDDAREGRNYLNRSYSLYIQCSTIDHFQYINGKTNIEKVVF
jgi:hypothetical protein